MCAAIINSLTRRQVSAPLLLFPHVHTWLKRDEESEEGKKARMHCRDAGVNRIPVSLTQPSSDQHHPQPDRKVSACPRAQVPFSGC